MYRTSAPAAGGAISTRGVGLHTDELESMSDLGRGEPLAGGSRNDVIPGIDRAITSCRPW